MATKLERLEAICAKMPNDPFAWYTLALEKRKSDVNGAIAIFERIHRDHSSYLPNYYQFAKALVETHDRDRAVLIYREGMNVAEAANDAHTFGELQAALDAVR